MCNGVRPANVATKSRGAWVTVFRPAQGIGPALRGLASRRTRVPPSGGTRAGGRTRERNPISLRADGFQQRLDRLDRVGGVRGLVVAVAADPREAQRDAAGVAARRLHAVECDFDDQLGTHVHGDPVAADLARRAAPASATRSMASVRPLNVLPTMTNVPSGPRAPRCRFESQPCRRPWPHSAASTTRSSVRTGFTLRHAPPRRPAS